MGFKTWFGKKEKVKYGVEPKFIEPAMAKTFKKVTKAWSDDVATRIKKLETIGDSWDIPYVKDEEIETIEPKPKKKNLKVKEVDADYEGI